MYERQTRHIQTLNPKTMKPKFVSPKPGPEPKMRNPRLQNTVLNLVNSCKTLAIPHEPYEQFEALML